MPHCSAVNPPSSPTDEPRDTLQTYHIRYICNVSVAESRTYRRFGYAVAAVSSLGPHFDVLIGTDVGPALTIAVVAEGVVCRWG
jgi:hypothetical protein